MGLQGAERPVSEPLAPVLQVVNEAMKAEGVSEAQRRSVIARLLATALTASSAQREVS